MKKLIVKIACALFATTAFCDTNNVPAEAVDVYSFKASIKQPLLKNGIRQYIGVILKGNLYLEYATTDDSVTAAYAIVQNSKTKVQHRIEFDTGFYNLMGKSSKTSLRSVPTILFTGADAECVAGTGKGATEPHETIKNIQIAGTGTLKKTKSTIVACGTCGVGVSTTTYCNKLAKMTGNVNGYMDCECPEDEDWNHTAETTICGVKLDTDGNIVRSHNAAFWGNWTATYVKTVAGE